MVMVRKAILLMPLLLFSGLLAVSEETSEPQVDRVETNDSINTVLDELSAKLYGLGAELEQAVEDQRDNDEQLMESIDRLSRSLEEFETTYISNIKNNRLGAFLLIAGLLIEVVGATLLAGPNIAAKQEPIFHARVFSPLTDLQMGDIHIAPLVAFWGAVGSVLLVLGFIFQFAGTVLVLALTTTQIMISIVIVVVCPLTIFLYLTGQTAQQTRRQKMGVVTKNLLRLMVSPFLDLVLGPKFIQCDHCLRYSHRSKIKIWYIKEDTTPEHEHLHAPHVFHKGHDICLRKIDDYRTLLEKNRSMHTANYRVHRRTVDEFTQKDYPQLKEWFAQNKSPQQYGPNYYETEMEKLRRKIK